MKTGKYIDSTYGHLGDDRLYTIDFTECTIECKVRYTSERHEETGVGDGGTSHEPTILDMDIFDFVGDRVPLSEINEEEVYESINEYIQY